MTKLLARAIPIVAWVKGLMQDVDASVAPHGSLADGANFIPTKAGQLAIRGGSRILLTLHDDAGTPAELSHVCLITPFTPSGAVAVGWSDGQNKHYAYRLTTAVAFVTGAEATSRTALWTTLNNTAPARPIPAELFEKLFLADAVTDQTTRNGLVSLNSAGTITTPTFVFAGGAANALLAYVCEEYNGVIFIGGYGDEGDKDRPEMLRHSYLGRSPDATGAGVEGFDKDAYLLLGSKGQRVTALRKGRGLLLAAKANEFYRISGFGRAYPGWQYTVESVSNTLGLGVSNPHALTFAEGYWYGLGQQGPLRTDGYQVESLASPRERGWRGMDNADLAWVAYHPERRVVLFGLHPITASAGRSTTYPWTIWVWDIVREVWQPDLTFGADFFMASPLAPSGAASSAGPTASPSAPVTSAATMSGYTAGWTNGDATAQTEVWQKLGAGGTWTLLTTVGAGVASYGVTGDVNHNEYWWKVRHTKTGITSDYTAETVAQTLISPPFILFTLPVPGIKSVDVHSNADGTVTLTLESSPTGAGTWTVQATWTGVVGIGAVRSLTKASTDPARDWRAKATDSGWSVPSSGYSSTVNG